jgi:hypothetical protein
MTTVITRVPDGYDAWGKNKVQFVDYTLSGTYAALTINASDVGLKFFRGVDVAGSDASLGTYFPVFDYTTFVGGLPTSVKLRLYTATATEASGTLSPTVNVRVCFIGG